MDVANCTVTGSGATGQLVTVAYAVTFQPRAGATSNTVEVEATDNAGNAQGFEQAGTLAVSKAQGDRD